MEELSAVILLQRILDDAVARGASDVHLHFTDEALQVQFRIGGHVVSFVQVPDPFGTVIRRIKALGRMDVAEARIPQDGAFQWVTESSDGLPGRRCDVRVAVVPTVGGETAVLRLFERGGAAPSLADLGVAPAQLAQLRALLMRDAGMILVAGPTGSGKTTTLYAMLQELSRWGRRVVSIEDPVEMQMPGWQQMEVREHIGVTFDASLRAVLRQDPDAIMIGEIRDEQTARAALRAAMTGHLVLSTTHARDLIGAAARLVDLGLPRELLGEVLCAVVAQELLYVRCEACGGEGCPDCAGSGHTGQRRAIFRILEMDGVLAAEVASHRSWSELRGVWTGRAESPAVRPLAPARPGRKAGDDGCP